jgi:exodeoxyribonuclease III
MRVITLNVNGLRSATKRGLFPWLAQQSPDVVCLQEVRASEAQLAEIDCKLPGYFHHYYAAERPGYAGVAVYARQEPKRVLSGFGVPEFDNEGRFLELQFDRWSVVSLYLPSGSSGEHRQASKFRFLEAFMPHLKKLKRARREYILCGDWNIAHQQIDLKNWKANQKNSGFLPEERAWLDRLFGEVGYIDGFRSVVSEPDHYTWWSNRGQAWAKNVGWRIDYQILSPGLAGAVKKAHIYKDQRFSDHAPLIMDYDGL